MSVVRPYLEARALLGVTPQASAADLKAAYRRLVQQHPPDLDPEGFRRVRGAYELLLDPGERARDILLRPMPAIDPPPLPDLDEEATSRGATALAVLRAVVMRIDPDLLVGVAPPAREGKQR